MAEAGERKLLTEGSQHAARRLSHVVRCACFACCLSLLPFHLYPGRHLAIARRLLHVRHRIVSVACCMSAHYVLSLFHLHIYIYVAHRRLHVVCPTLHDVRCTCSCCAQAKLANAELLTEDERGRFARLDIDPSTITWNRVCRDYNAACNGPHATCNK